LANASAAVNINGKKFVWFDGENDMARKAPDDDPLLLAQILRSFNLDETTSAARFIESLAFDTIFREEWESIYGNQHQLQFYDRLADDIFDALENHGGVENSVREQASQLLGEIQGHYEWLCKHLLGTENREIDQKRKSCLFDGDRRYKYRNPFSE